MSVKDLLVNNDFDIICSGFQLLTNPGAGLVLTSDAFGNGFWGTGGGKLPSSVSVILTPTQIVGLNTAPLLVIPSQGPGNIIIPTSCYFKLEFNTTPYTEIKGADSYLFQYSDTSVCSNSVFNTTDVIHSATFIRYDSFNGFVSAYNSASGSGIYLAKDNINSGVHNGDSNVLLVIDYILQT